jgi:hypothetical protein
MRRTLGLCVATVAACVQATTNAGAQMPILPGTDPAAKATIGVTPSKAGTPRRPVGVDLTVDATLNPPPGTDATPVTGFEVWLGPGLTFDRGAVPACSASTLRRGGPAKCPRKSIVGRGRVTTPQDPMLDLPSGGGTSVVFINGPGEAMTAYVQRSLPRIRVAVPSTVVDGARGSWPHRDAWFFPSALQLAAGITLMANGVTFDIRGTSSPMPYVRSTGCPKGGWTWKVRLHWVNPTTDVGGVSDTQGHAPCTARR